MGSACSKGVLSQATVSPAPEEPAPAARPPAGVSHLPVGYTSRRRGSVSAEPSGASGSQLKRPPSLPSAGHDAAAHKIRDLVRNTLLFKELDDEQHAAVIEAMTERRVDAGEVVIREGEEADNFYVIESGRFEATKGDAPVFTYEGQGSFGELALMYNCPRAATVTALSEGVLWALERATFRSLVVNSMAERRTRYEGVLRGMPVFQDLSQEQLAAVADCLHAETFEAGEYILWERAPLDDSAKFYIIEAGVVDCFRTFEGQKRAVKSLTDGDVFGEVALLTKAPRQADCVAATKCKCLTLSRDAFERLMGPVEQSLAAQIKAYQASNAQVEAASAGTGARTADAAATDASAPVAGGTPQSSARSAHAAPASAAGGAPLPGSPRPRVSDSAPASWRRSKGGRSAGSESDSPTGSPSATQALGAALAAAGGDAGAAGAAGEEQPLPPIAEETAEAAAAAAAVADFAAAAEQAQEAADAEQAPAAEREAAVEAAAAAEPAAAPAGAKKPAPAKKAGAAPAARKGPARKGGK
ncbi:cAMP-dependent kinase regulatory subunit [Micractinium conductrix]|uniref:cAMP-dependent kinase regulatory subunit n=1 Tax=Micractinium conductrix TaxID=554055 RepID=A0A2P6VRT2_9CHLO|nr:cAMP-dependent kinase regulatory subunit [Micractinium conductrix]|eukprot:PSC76791.1 cAMP-dependent kinase regulatory subunit [Micractinium conductrix]